MQNAAGVTGVAAIAIGAFPRRGASIVDRAQRTRRADARAGLI
jgi:hypothetical protein